MDFAVCVGGLAWSVSQYSGCRAEFCTADSFRVAIPLAPDACYDSVIAVFIVYVVIVIFISHACACAVPLKTNLYNIMLVKCHVHQACCV